MNNVNAPAHLAEYADEHDIDLTEYRTELELLDKSHRFIDIEPPFANDVLIRIRTGMALTDAIAEARRIAFAALDAQS